jgi:amidohydrolase
MLTNEEWVGSSVSLLVPRILEHRRHLHQFPEVSFSERMTAAYIGEQLEAMGLELKGMLGGTGLVSEVVGLRASDEPGRNLMIRADIDALPITEADDGRNCRSSIEGVMHACGHDAHTAIVLGVAEVLNSHRSEFAGSVRFLFQPAEERLGGAKRMIAAGALDDPPVDAVLGLHVLSQLEVGQVGVTNGPLFASADEFTLTVTGRGGHGALPHQTTDPIPVACSIVMALQTLISREVSPFDSAVVTIATIHGGEVFNTIPDSVVLGGSVRAFRPELRMKLLQRVEEMAALVASSFGARTSFEIGAGAPPAISDPAMAELVRAVVKTTDGATLVEVGSLTPADDMAEFLISVPGCYFLLGAGNEKKGITAPHHHPRFDLDEDCLELGATVLTRCALEYLASGALTEATDVDSEVGVVRRIDLGVEDREAPSESSPIRSVVRAKRSLQSFDQVE